MLCLSSPSLLLCNSCCSTSLILSYAFVFFYCLTYILVIFFPLCCVYCVPSCFSRNDLLPTHFTFWIKFVQRNKIKFLRNFSSVKTQGCGFKINFWIPLMKCYFYSDKWKKSSNNNQSRDHFKLLPFCSLNESNHVAREPNVDCMKMSAPPAKLRPLRRWAVKGP